MSLGLALLGIVALLIFFGVTEKFFRSIGIANWLAFILVLALVLGAILPEPMFGAHFSINISGFIIPIVMLVIFGVLIGLGSDLVRSVLALVAVAGVAVATRMLVMPTSFATIITASVIIGFVGGAVAYLIGVTRLSTLFAAVGGIVLGDIIVNLINYFMLSGTTFALGSTGVFDSIIIAAIFGILIAEAVAMLKRTMDRRKQTRTALSFESGEEHTFTENPEPVEEPIMHKNEDFSDYFED